jgi:hypothetical protein
MASSEMPNLVRASTPEPSPTYPLTEPLDMDKAETTDKSDSPTHQIETDETETSEHQPQKDSHVSDQSLALKGKGIDELELRASDDNTDDAFPATVTRQWSALKHCEGNTATASDTNNNSSFLVLEVSPLHPCNARG